MKQNKVKFVTFTPGDAAKTRTIPLWPTWTSLFSRCSKATSAARIESPNNSIFSGQGFQWRAIDWHWFAMTLRLVSRATDHCRWKLEETDYRYVYLLTTVCDKRCYKLIQEWTSWPPWYYGMTLSHGAENIILSTHDATEISQETRWSWIWRSIIFCMSRHRLLSSWFVWNSLFQIQYGCNDTDGLQRLTHSSHGAIQLYDFLDPPT